MTETENKAQKPTIYKAAIISPLLVIAGFLAMIISDVVPLKFESLCAVLFLIFVLAGLIWGIIADNRISKNKGKLSDRVFSIAGVVLAIVVIIDSFVPSPTRKISYQMICGSNMHGLGAALLIYSSDNHGCYPTSSKWCDLLMERCEVPKRQFTCTGSKSKNCSNYAINPEAKPNSPSDIVLLFETKDGWNQFGGPDLITFENHGGKGCNVLFNDCNIKFIKPNEVGKLRWK